MTYPPTAALTGPVDLELRKVEREIFAQKKLEIRSALRSFARQARQIRSRSPQRDGVRQGLERLRGKTTALIEVWRTLRGKPPAKVYLGDRRYFAVATSYVEWMVKYHARYLNQDLDPTAVFPAEETGD